MKQKILESNCWWIITRRENSQLHWLDEQGVLFWTSGVNELWPEIYNLAVSVMDLTPEHNSGELAHSSGLCAGQSPPGFGFCIPPCVWSPLKVAQEASASQGPLVLVGKRYLPLNPVATITAPGRKWKRWTTAIVLLVLVALKEFRKSFRSCGGWVGRPLSRL